MPVDAEINLGTDTTKKAIGKLTELHLCKTQKEFCIVIGKAT